MRNLKTGRKRPPRKDHLFNGTKPGPGRPKGALNKVTRDVREMIAAFAERKAMDFERWVERCAVRDPGKAATLYLAAIEYHIPRLQRTLHQVVPAFVGDARLVDDPIEAAAAYGRITRGEIAPDAIEFRPNVSDAPIPRAQHADRQSDSEPTRGPPNGV
jgi:hypothetical protein